MGGNGGRGEAKKRLHKGAWQVYWYAGRRAFSVGTGTSDEKTAEKMRLEVTLALMTGEWPAWAAGRPAVVRYRLAGIKGGAGGGADEWAASEVRCSPKTLRGYRGHVKEFLGWIKGLGISVELVGRKEAVAFLDQILVTAPPYLKGRDLHGKPGRSPRTRDRATIALRKYYRWLAEGGAVLENPFDGIPLVGAGKRAAAVEIAYFTRDERERILAQADRCADGVAAWIGFYAGLRLGEIARLRWDDVGEDVIEVRAGKTGHRVVPLAAVLGERLGRVKRKGQRVVPWPADDVAWEHAARALRDRLRELVAEADRRKRIKAAARIRVGDIGWNAFRHTFATLLVQAPARIGLDTLTAWMGNTPDVCRRHYARFVPREGKDEAIDTL